MTLLAEALSTLGGVLCTGDTMVAFATCVLAVVIPMGVKQHHRRAPTFAQGGTFVPAPLIYDLDYKSQFQQIVPASALEAVIVVVPAAVFSLLGAFDARPKRVAIAAARVHSLLYAFAATSVTVDCVKKFCGYWRPYFYDECGFDVATGRCGGDAPDDANRSFPSGHSALSMVCLLHSSLCLLGAARLGRPLRVFGGAVDVGGPAVFACLAPAFLALWIAASRVVDNDHWPADVVGGATLGAAFALCFYARYFPPVFDAASHEPRPAFLPPPPGGDVPSAPALDGATESPMLA